MDWHDPMKWLYPEETGTEACPHCGWGDCSGELRYVAQPFLAEIHEEVKMVWLCPGRYQEIAADI